MRHSFWHGRVPHATSVLDKMGDAFLAAFSVGQRVAFGRRAARNPRSLAKHMLNHGLVGIALGGLGFVAGGVVGAGAGLAWGLTGGRNRDQDAAAGTNRAAASAAAVAATVLRGAHLGALLGAVVGLGVTHGLAVASIYLGAAGGMAFALTGLVLGAVERGAEALVGLGGRRRTRATFFSGIGNPITTAPGRPLKTCQ